MVQWGNTLARARGGKAQRGFSKKFYQIRRGTDQFLIILDRHHHNGLNASLGHDLWTVAKRAPDQLAESIFRFLELPMIHHRFTSALTVEPVPSPALRLSKGACRRRHVRLIYLATPLPLPLQTPPQRRRDLRLERGIHGWTQAKKVKGGPLRFSCPHALHPFFPLKGSRFFP